jgi:hypothetical protein
MHQPPSNHPPKKLAKTDHATIPPTTWDGAAPPDMRALAAERIQLKRELDRLEQEMHAYLMQLGLI